MTEFSKSKNRFSIPHPQFSPIKHKQCSWCVCTGVSPFTSSKITEVHSTNSTIPGSTDGNIEKPPDACYEKSQRSSPKFEPSPVAPTLSCQRSKVSKNPCSLYIQSLILKHLHRSVCPLKFPIGSKQAPHRVPFDRGQQTLWAVASTQVSCLAVFRDSPECSCPPNEEDFTWYQVRML